jgi:uncharacterized membrane protein YdjX (TVP38/TMEM64 family)
MIPTDPKVSRARRMLALKAVVVLAVLGVAGLFMLRGLEVKTLYTQTLDLIRSFGPVAFFGAMAILPALGCPISIFTLAVGPVFGAQLGLPWILVISGAVIMFNLAFAYWIARFALRPWVQWLFTWLGYSLPQVATADRLSLTVLVRVTPGPPYFVQNFILGLTGVPFGLYMTVSSLICISFSFAFILFGDSIAQGKGKVVLLSISLFVALSVGVQFVRRHFSRRREVK